MYDARRLSGWSVSVLFGIYDAPCLALGHWRCCRWGNIGGGDGGGDPGADGGGGGGGSAAAFAGSTKAEEDGGEGKE